MTEAATPANITLNNGVEIPQLGFGTFQIEPGKTAQAVRTALEIGYRHIDTAQMYGNEQGVGEAVRGSGLPRGDIFVTSKLNNGQHAYDDALRAFDQTLAELGLDYLDLFLIHWPTPNTGDFTETWKAMEAMHRSGRVRAIGVSNFEPEHLERIFETSDTVPAVNQIEVHPYFRQPELLALNAEHGILTQAWSPIGGITFYRDGEHTSTLQDPVINEIARAHGKSPAQVMLRWHLQQGRSAIPKSVTPSRIAENFDVLDFELSNAQLARIDALDTGIRGGPDPADLTLESAGRHIPES